MLAQAVRARRSSSPSSGWPCSGSSPSRRPCRRARSAAHTPNARERQGRCSMPAAAPPATRRPGRTTRRKLGGGLGLKSPFGTFYVPNISPDPNDGIGNWSEARFRHRDAEGHVAGRPALFPGVSLHVLSAHAHRRRARPVRATSRRCRPVQGKVRDHDVPFPFNVRRTLGGWKFLFLDGKPFQPDPIQVRAMESRRLSGERPRPLRRMPLAAQSARRHRRRASASPAARIRKARAGSRTSRSRAWRLVRQGHRLPARDRQHAGRRFGRRLDGAGDPQHLAAFRGRPRRDGGLHQVAAAGGRAEEAGEAK